MCWSFDARYQIAGAFFESLSSKQRLRITIIILIAALGSCFLRMKADAWCPPLPPPPHHQLVIVHVDLVVQVN